MKGKFISIDLKCNRIFVKPIFTVLYYGTSVWLARCSNSAIIFLGFPIRILNKFVIKFIMRVELSVRNIVSSGLAVYHGVGLVMNANTRLGENVTPSQNTTIGSKLDGAQPPIIGDNVSVGANCIITGDIQVGSNSVIGAGAILIESCPECGFVRGQKAMITRSRAQQVEDHV